MNNQLVILSERLRVLDDFDPPVEIQPFVQDNVKCLDGQDVAPESQPSFPSAHRVSWG